MAIPAPAPDRTCIVTGASSGIGVEIARQLAERGHGVTLVARRRDRLEALATELAERHGVRTEVAACDLSDHDARRELIADVEGRGLTIDVLVNNAGFSTMGPVARADPDREVAMVRTNVEAVSHLCALVVGGMVERQRGAILNVASTASFQPMPGQAGYAASKSFVRSYTLALAAEVSGTGVSVSALCPGPVETGFADAAGLDGFQSGDALPAPFWVDAAEVAARGLEGLEADRAVVIPGALNRLGAVAAHLTPRKLLVTLLARRHPAMNR